MTERKELLTHGQIVKGKHSHTFKDKVYDVDTFYKEVYWEEIVFINNRLMHRIWRYNRSDFPCPSCQKSQDVEFNIQSTGVTMKCQYCQLTTLAVPYRVGDSGEEGEIAEIVSSEEVTVPQALKITERTGQDSEFLAPLIPRPRERLRHVHLEDEIKELQTGGD